MEELLNDLNHNIIINYQSMVVKGVSRRIYHYLGFDIEIVIKENYIKIVFEDLVIKTDNINNLKTPIKNYLERRMV